MHCDGIDTGGRTAVVNCTSAATLILFSAAAAGTLRRVARLVWTLSREGTLELVERIARVIAGYRLSINAEGGIVSAGDEVDAEWPTHQGQALAILKVIQEPSPSMEKFGMGKEWEVLVGREVALAEGAGQ